jgi:hypothetical protein
VILSQVHKNTYNVQTKSESFGRNRTNANCNFSIFLSNQSFGLRFKTLSHIIPDILGISMKVFNNLKIFMGGIYGWVRPDPFPNSEVKTACANDSPTHVGAKVGSRPLYKKPFLNGKVFLFAIITLCYILLFCLGC